MNTQTNPYNEKVSHSFVQYDGDLMGLPTDQNHKVVLWTKGLKPNRKVIFSFAQIGDGMSCHFAADPKAFISIRLAIPEFCQYIFENYVWCKMVLGKVKDPKVGRIIERFGFKKILEVEQYLIYMRKNPWVE